MKREERRIYGYLRRLCLASALTAGLAMAAGSSPGVAQSVDPDAIAGNSEAVSQLSPFDTTVAYVVQFYPLWFTYYQSQLASSSRNQLVGPDRISPLYHYVVAINVDTIYASSYLDLSAQPVVLTIPPATVTYPPTTVTYSILMLDPYGDVFDAGIPPKTAGNLCAHRTRIYRHASHRGHSHRDASRLFGFDLQDRQIHPKWREPDRSSRGVPQVTQESDP